MDGFLFLGKKKLSWKKSLTENGQTVRRRRRHHHHHYHRRRCLRLAWTTMNEFPDWLTKLKGPNEHTDCSNDQSIDRSKLMMGRGVPFCILSVCCFFFRFAAFLCRSDLTCARQRKQKLNKNIFFFDHQIKTYAVHICISWLALLLTFDLKSEKKITESNKDLRV